VPNYGAGDLLEIRPVGRQQTELLPFTDACVPEVDLPRGRVVVRLPELVAGDDEGGPAEDPGGAAG
jgi:16S rRNA processing protein RimM